MIRLSCLLIAVVCVLLPIGAKRTAIADDWPAWRGPNRDAICGETGLLKQWPKEGPKLAWKATGMGEGYSGPAIVANRLYIMGNLDGEECVLALDLESRKRLWTRPFGPVEYTGYSPGTRATPTIDGDRLYALGASGTLIAMERETGRVVWKKNYVRDFGGAVPRWGYAESVLIDGKLLLCTPGGERATIAALNKMTGETVWTSPVGDAANYSSIVKTTLADVPQYVQYVSHGVIGLDARNGKLLWRYDAPAYTMYGGINISTVVCHKDTVFAASGYGVGGGLARVSRSGDEFKAEQLYFTKDMKNHHGGMVYLDGHLYGANDPGILMCLEHATGRVKWAARGPGKCSLLLADGMLYCRDENGPLSLVEATPEEFRLRGQFDQPQRSDQKAWPHLVIAGGMMCVRDQDVLLCYDVREN